MSSFTNKWLHLTTRTFTTHANIIKVDLLSCRQHGNGYRLKLPSQQIISLSLHRSLYQKYFHPQRLNNTSTINLSAPPSSENTIATSRSSTSRSLVHLLTYYFSIFWIPLWFTTGGPHSVTFSWFKGSWKAITTLYRITSPLQTTAFPHSLSLISQHILTIAIAYQHHGNHQSSSFTDLQRDGIPSECPIVEDAISWISVSCTLTCLFPACWNISDQWCDWLHSGFTSHNTLGQISKQA